MKDKNNDDIFPPSKGSNRGGDSNGKDSRNYKHGIYISKLIDQEEFTLFEELWNKLHEEFDLNESSDRMSAELACIYFVRLQRALKAENEDAAKSLDFMLRQQLQLLKSTRISRQGETTNVNVNTSPAEWAVDLLERAKADGDRKAEEKRKQQKKKKPEEDED